MINQWSNTTCDPISCQCSLVMTVSCGEFDPAVPTPTKANRSAVQAILCGMSCGSRQDYRIISSRPQGGESSQVQIRHARTIYVSVTGRSLQSRESATRSQTSADPRSSKSRGGGIRSKAPGIQGRLQAFRLPRTDHLNEEATADRRPACSKHPVADLLALEWSNKIWRRRS